MNGMFLISVTIEGESFDSYLSALRSLIKTCNFGTLQDNLLRDRVVLRNTRENSTKKKLLAESKLTLEKCISICRANETTSKQLQEIASEEVNAINSARRPSHSTENPPSKRTAATGVPRNKGSGPGQRRESQIKCKFCLKTHEKRKNRVLRGTNPVTLVEFPIISWGHRYAGVRRRQGAG